MVWFDLEALANKNKLHKYMRNYMSHLLQRILRMIKAVVMAGGSGSQDSGLMSRAGHPKQFLSLFGGKETMLPVNHETAFRWA